MRMSVPDCVPAGAILAGIALAAHAHALTLINALGDVDRNLILHAHTACAVAFVARVLDDLTSAVATAARRSVDHAAERRVVHGLALTCTTAVGALLCRRARLRTAAVTVGAGISTRHL